MPPKVTINELYTMLTDFIQNKAVTKDDLKELAKTSDLEALEKKVDEMQKSMETLTQTVASNTAENSKLKNRVTELEDTVKTLKSKEVMREMHDRRRNLLLFGKEESANESKTDCRDFVRGLLTKMRVPNAESITIVDAHRLGKTKGKRPIIFSVPDMFIVKNIIDQIPVLKTFDNGLYFRKHLPKAMRDEREKLKGKMKALYDADQQPKWQIDFDNYSSYILDKTGKKHYATDVITEEEE